MKRILLASLMTGVALYATQVQAGITICSGEYALCAASGSVPTGKTILVQGKKFREGVAVCPVLVGTAVANMELMHHTCKAPEGQVWSLFGLPLPTTFPQAPSWNSVAPVVRSFTVEEGKDSGMSNQWSFLCTKRPLPTLSIDGHLVLLADCVGPINESPWTNGHVKIGTTAFTEAPIGTPNPVGGNFPNN
jgi:hypothetical protein